MTEKQIKMIYKYVIENGSKPLTRDEKEIIKQEIEKAKNYEELALVALQLIIKK